ncbi:MAG: hypothetical protein V3R99_12100 [Thermoguttaceae bacterium]
MRPLTLCLLTGLLLLSLLTPSSTGAGELFGWYPGKHLHRLHDHLTGPPQPIDPRPRVAAPPGPHRYPEYNAAAAPWYGYGFGVPTYSWGHFGATYRPAAVAHHGYYGDFTQWGYRRGY